MKYDLIIIGAGPGGYQAALEAAENGLNVAVIEKGNLGGACLNEGCIPTKALLYSSNLLRKVSGGTCYGLNANEVSIDLQAVVKRKDTIVTALRKGLTAKLSKKNVCFFEGTAALVSVKDNVKVTLNNDVILEGKKLIIATGSKMFCPAIEGVEEGINAGFVMNTEQFLNNCMIYKKVVIIGAGVIGIEFASFLANIGTEVILVDIREEIFPEIDDDTRRRFLRSLKSDKVQIKTGIGISKISVDGYICLDDDKRTVVTCDKIILCTGRVPNTDDLELEKFGICTEDKAIVTDLFCRTNNDNVYAVGDVNGRSMLAHTAYIEAKTAIDHICDKTSEINYDLVPKVVFSNPEIAWVGKMERDLQRNSVDYVVKFCSMKYSGKFVIENESECGYCKLIVDRQDKVIGCVLLGNGASELIVTMEIIIREQKTIDDLKNLIFPHPTIGEAIRECAYM